MSGEFKPNFLLQNVMPILVLIITLKNIQPNVDIKFLRKKIVLQIKNFEYTLKKYKYSSNVVKESKYCLLAILDEVILKTKWGVENFWDQQSLVSEFYHELDRGNKFYSILDFALENPETNIDLLELFYVVLSLGYMGKLYNDEDRLFAIKQNIFESITLYKSDNVSIHNDGGLIKKPAFYTMFVGLILMLLILMMTMLFIKANNVKSDKYICSLISSEII